MGRWRWFFWFSWGLLHSLAAGGNPFFVFSGEVQNADASLGELVAPGDVLSGTLTLKPLTPDDQLAEDPATGKYEAFLHDAEVTLDRHYLLRASYRFDGSRPDIAYCRRGDLDHGQPQTITLAIPVDGQVLGKNWQAVWLEFWLYDTRFRMLPDDAFPRRKFAWESGTFRLTYLDLESGGFSYYSGRITQFSDELPEDTDPKAVIAQLEAMVLELNQIIDRQQQELVHLQKRIEETGSRERLLEEQLRQAREAAEGSAIRQENVRLSSELEEQRQTGLAMRDQILDLELAQAEAAVREKEWLDRNNALQKALVSAQEESERWQSLVANAQADLLRMQAVQRTMQAGIAPDEKELLGTPAEAASADSPPVSPVEVTAATEILGAEAGPPTRPQTLADYTLWQTAQRQRLEALEAASQSGEKKTATIRGPRRR